MIRPTAPDVTRVAFVGDVHAPKHDPQAVALCLSFLRWYRPHELYLIGDIADTEQLSAYAQDPDRLTQLQADLDVCAGVLAEFRRAVGRRCRVTCMEGNHEDRLRRWLSDNPRVAKLRALTIPALLGLDRLGFEHHPYEGPIRRGDLLIEHGDRVSRHSGYTARAMLDARGVSGISGHTHRLGVHYRTTEAGEIAWWENGCLCDVRPGYVIGRPNWQQGFTVGAIWQNRFHLEQVRIAHGRIFYAGRLWQAGKRKAVAK